jgi:hypothetical protein
MDNFTNRIHLFISKHPRKFGLINLILGMCLVFWTIGLPVLQAELQEGSVKLSLRGMSIGVLFSLFGLTYIIFGSRFNYFARHYLSEQRAIDSAWVGGIIIGSIGVGIFYSLQTLLKTKGYYISR